MYQLRILGLTALTALAAFGLASGAHAGINGFNGGTGFTLNSSGTPGVPSVSGGTATLTDGGGSENASLFFNTPQNISTFSASFTYQAGGARAGDGFAFVLQNDTRGANALGQGGGSLGYGGTGAITPSAAVEFNLYAPNGVGTSFQTGGATGPYTSTGSVAFGGGDPINVLLTYNGTTLFESLTDPTAGTAFSTSYATNLVSAVGGSGTALVGFTGGTGAANSVQTVSNFQFTAGAPVPEASATVSLGLLLALGLAVAGRRRKSAKPS